MSLGPDNIRKLILNFLCFTYELFIEIPSTGLSQVIQVTDQIEKFHSRINDFYTVVYPSLERIQELGNTILRAQDIWKHDPDYVSAIVSDLAVIGKFVSRLPRRVNQDTLDHIEDLQTIVDNLNVA